MNGKKSADHIITGIREGDNGRVESVLIGEDPIYGNQVKTDIKTREYVVNLIKNGKKVITSRANTEGASVHYYKESNGQEYLRTDPNCSSFDNLDNLPKF